MDKRIINYCETVLADVDRVDHCEALQQAITRFKTDLDKSLHDDFEFYLDEREAARAVAFIERQKINSGENAGELMRLDPWQVFFVSNIFGWRFKSDKNRLRFKKALGFLAKGSGKSPLSAVMALYAQTLEQGGEVYSLATSREQAEISFNHAKGYVQSNEQMKDLFEVFSHAIVYKPKNASFKTLSSAWRKSDGKNPVCVIADEIAAMSDSKIIDPIESALFKRKNSIEIMITTANFISVYSPGYVEYGYAKQILAGAETGVMKDDRYFALIYEIDKDDDWKTVSLKKANPSSFANLDDLEQKRQEAITRGGTYEQELCTKNLNIWLIGASNEWLPIAKWMSVIDNAKTFADYLTPDKLKTYPAAIGADFSTRRDLSVFTCAYYIKEIDKIYLQHYPYIPQVELARKARNENQLYLDWVSKGLITLCPEEFISKPQIAHDINAKIEETGAKSFGYDPALSSDIIEEIKIPIVPYNQKSGMSQPAIDLEEMIYAGRIIDDNPVMYWCISNARVYRRDDYTHVEKENKDSPKKIDLVISSIMACHRLQEVARISAVPPVNVDYNALAKLIYG